MAFVFPASATTAQRQAIRSGISRDVTKSKLSADNTFARKNSLQS
jgi:hypothetical protein